MDFLYQLYEKNTKEINDPITKSIGVTLNALYGTTLEGVSTLSLHDLFLLLRSQSYYAVFHSLLEINHRSFSIVKDFSFIMMNTKISRRFMSSISSSLRRSMSSISVLSTNEEEEEIFENDFLFKAVHFSQNRGNEINQIILNIQQQDTTQPSTAIKRMRTSIRSSYQSQFSLSQINEDESIDLTDFNETTQSVTLLKDLITACGNGAYGSLRFPICVLCSAILINYCSNPQLCTLMWNEGIVLY